MPFHANGFVSMLKNVTFYSKILNEHDKGVNECNKINVFLRLRSALMIVYFLIMNSKRCNWFSDECILFRYHELRLYRS